MLPEGSIANNILIPTPVLLAFVGGVFIGHVSPALRRENREPSSSRPANSLASARTGGLGPRRFAAVNPRGELGVIGVRRLRSGHGSRSCQDPVMGAPAFLLNEWDNVYSV